MFWISLLLLLLLPLAFTLSVVTWVGVGHLGYVRYHRANGTPPPALGKRGWLRLYLRTIGGAFRVAWWHLRALGHNGLRVPEGSKDRSPVLCVHGFLMNGSCMWGIRRHLERLGHPTRALSLGLPYRDPAVYAACLRRAVDELQAGSSRPVSLVAHSMGGLVVRHALAETPELSLRVGRIVTLGTPHQGTALLRGARRGPVVEMMGPDSDYLRKLPGFVECAPHTAVTTVGTWHDVIVYPLETAHLPGTKRRTLQGIGHLGLLTEPEAHRTIAEALE